MTWSNAAGERESAALVGPTSEAPDPNCSSGDAQQPTDQTVFVLSSFKGINVFEGDAFFFRKVTETFLDKERGKKHLKIYCCAM